MASLFLIRHGRAAASFGEHRDPGLDAIGQRQAEASATELAGLAPTPLPIFTSPLARARQTAAPLAARWARAPTIDARIAEIPTPSAELGRRAAWLTGVMDRRWADLPAAAQAWRQALVDWAAGQRTDAVAFSHFIAINALVGAALGEDRVVVFRPDNASITRLTTEDGRLALVAKGREAPSRVN